ncbi:MAG TPA: class I tRNA ligase family protein, partial [Polyangia bacterium]
MVAAHPLAGLDAGYGFAVPLLAGEHVTDDAGTGFVHTAPGHGQDDYEVWLKSGRSRADIPDTVDPDGAYYDHVPLFGGLKVMETEGKKAGKFGPANSEVMNRLIEAGNLLARGRVEHSYPHSWRSKAPVIFRNTPQWFIGMDRKLESGRTLRETALAAIDATAFYPRTGQTRIRSMVEGRPDWLISRQRAWGTPLAMFVDRRTGEPLRDEAVNQRILTAIAAEGADAWFTHDPREFLGNERDIEDYEKIEDILDVWFDSGSTHAFVLEGRDDAKSPADLYLEGSDQARGWFQSSLLESCGTRGRAPYEGVLTHGFVLDEHGEKMSKSKGNTVEPQSVTKDSGAEILRLWVALSDYAEDLRIGKTILQTTIDSYRKLRNTLRYMLGALDGFTDAERVGYDQMPPLERYVLHRLWQLDTQVREAYEKHRYDEVWRPVTEFAAQELSALYFDVRKDALYCDAPSSIRRRACRTVMDLAFERLTVWLGPIAVFTTEEAWATRFPDAGANALRIFPQTPAEWRNDAEAERWGKIETVLAVVTGALEVERREKRIGSALEAAPEVTLADSALKAAFDGVDPAEVFRTSQAELSVGGDAEGFMLDDAPGISVRPFRAEGNKCARCWRVLPEVAVDLCNRCTSAVAEIDA